MKLFFLAGLASLLSACASSGDYTSDIDLIVTGRSVKAEPIVLDLPPHGFTQLSVVHTFEITGRASGYSSPEYLSLGSEPYHTDGVEITILDDRMRYHQDVDYSAASESDNPIDCPMQTEVDRHYLVFLHKLEGAEGFDYLIRACSPVDEKESYGLVD